MDIEEFWRIIHESQRGYGPGSDPMDRQLCALRRLLSEMQPGQILEFANHFRNCLIALFSWDLWGVAFIMGEGCSDDGFGDFRRKLISMGRSVFENALEDPESVVNPLSVPGIGDFFFEEFQGVAGEVYEEMTDREVELPDSAPAWPKSPSGEKFSEDPEDLRRRFPRTWEKFGWSD